jgi:hypothetical protein
MYIKKNFKRLKIYTTILISLFTIGLFAYGEIVLLNKNAISVVPDVPINPEDPDSASKHYFLNLHQLTCNKTTELALYNLVTVKVYKPNPNMENGLELLTFWGPKQLTPGNSEAVNINVEFQNQVIIIATYSDYNGAEQNLGNVTLNRLNRDNSVNFVNNGADYLLSYSIQAVNYAI